MGALPRKRVGAAGLEEGWSKVGLAAGEGGGGLGQQELCSFQPPKHPLSRKDPTQVVSEACSRERE